ncbi:MAG: cell envelope integrity protein TolA [Thermodesulfobacteriota bacterium]
MVFSQVQTAAIEPAESGRFLAVMIGLSLLAHVLLGTILLVLPQIAVSSPRIPASISVDLVSMVGPAGPVAKGSPKAKPSGPKIASLPKPKTEPKTEPVKPPEPKAAKVLPPDKTKKKAPDKKKSLAEALAAIQKQVRNRKEDSVAAAISAIREKENAAAEGGAAAAGPGVPGGIASRAFDVMDLYNLEMKDQITRKWAYPPAMAKDPSRLVVEILITIERDGRISEITLVSRSGDSAFDDSVLRAVRLSDPLPPLPSSFREKSRSVSIQFKATDLLPWATGGRG